TAVLDPWLRAHLYAQRCEDIEKRFLELIAGKEFKFSDPQSFWDGQYRGQGPYLGMQQKYEVLVLPSQAVHVTFLNEHCGLQIKRRQRWHYTDKGSLALICHAEQGHLRIDAALHGHIAFNLAHNLFDGLLHYNYDTPVWLHEGLAHFMEREVDPKYN